MLTAISYSENNVSNVRGPHARGLERAAARFGDRDASGSATITGPSPTSTARPTPSPTTSPPRRRPADRVAVMMTNRVEFIVAVQAISRVGAAAVLVSPAWKTTEVGHALTVTGARQGVADGAGAECSPAPWAGGGHRPRRPGTAALVATQAGPAASPPGAAPTTPCSSSARAPPACPRRCATPTGRSSPRAIHWVSALGLSPDDRFQVATPPSHILGLLNLVAAHVAGPTVGSTPASTSTRCSPHPGRPDDPRDGRRPDRAGDGEPSRPREVRPLVAALHHVGRHPGHRERRRHRHGALGRALAPRLRGERAARHRRQPGRPAPTAGGSTRRGSPLRRRAARRRPRHRRGPAAGRGRRDPGPRARR